LKSSVGYPPTAGSFSPSPNPIRARCSTGLLIDDIDASVLAAESSLNKHYWALFSLAYGLQAQLVFEFGVGGSTGVLLAALELTGGRLISCDTEPLESLCGRIAHLRKAASPARWTFRNMDSSAALRSLHTEAFELVLHDGSHEAEQVEQDIAGILPRLKRFGILLVHDVEQFALGPQVRRGLTAGIRRSRLRVSMTSLPYSDGWPSCGWRTTPAAARSPLAGARARRGRRWPRNCHGEQNGASSRGPARAESLIGKSAVTAENSPEFLSPTPPTT
jgi:predicted O-methyltransferase YrrM